MDIVDDLLSLPDFEPTETVPSLPVTGCVYAEVADNAGVCAVQSGWFTDFRVAVALGKESIAFDFLNSRVVWEGFLSQRSV